MKNKKGFTLIELLICILIIGVIAGIAIPQYKKAAGKAKLATIKGLTESIVQAERRYYIANNKTYTDDLTALDIKIPNGEDCKFAYKSAYCATRISGILVQYANSADNKWRRVLVWSRNEKDIPNQVCKQDSGGQAIIDDGSSYIYYTYNR